jgi:hypothetical protein
MSPEEKLRLTHIAEAAALMASCHNRSHKRPGQKYVPIETCEIDGSRNRRDLAIVKMAPPVCFFLRARAQRTQKHTARRSRNQALKKNRE